MSDTVKHILKEIWEWIYIIVIAFAAAFLIKAFIFDIVVVDGNSMFPTLHHKDKLIVTKLGYSPEQGDIIILDSTYKNREAYFDDLAEDQGKEKIGSLEKSFKYLSLPQHLKHKYYVKRVIALPGQTVDIQNGKVVVDGKVLDEPYFEGKTPITDRSVEYPVTVEEDTVFVMGDNRGNSTDSRSSSLGLVPYKAVLGKAQFRFFPFNAFGFLK